MLVFVFTLRDEYFHSGWQKYPRLDRAGMSGHFLASMQPESHKLLDVVGRRYRTDVVYVTCVYRLFLMTDFRGSQWLGLVRMAFFAPHSIF